MKPVVLPDVEHIIWDWNGTLLDDFHHTYLGIRAACRQLQLEEPSVEKVRDLCRHPLIDFWKDLGFDETRHEMQVVGEHFISAYETCANEDLHLHKEVPAILEGLFKRRVSCSILSAHVQELVENRAHALGIHDYFVNIQGTTRRDGHGKLFEAGELIQRISTPKEKILVIGDTSHDYEVAKLLGVSCALVSRGPESHERLQALGVPVFESLFELFPESLP